jgi:hypothetical protein
MIEEWKVVDLDHLETIAETFFTEMSDDIDENCTFSEPLGKKKKNQLYLKNDDLSKYWHQRYSYFSLFDRGKKLYLI